MPKRHAPGRGDGFGEGGKSSGQLTMPMEKDMSSISLLRQPNSPPRPSRSPYRHRGNIDLVANHNPCAGPRASEGYIELGSDVRLQIRRPILEPLREVLRRVNQHSFEIESLGLAEIHDGGAVGNGRFSPVAQLHRAKGVKIRL